MPLTVKEYGNNLVLCKFKEPSAVSKDIPLSGSYSGVVPIFTLFDKSGEISKPSGVLDGLYRIAVCDGSDIDEFVRNRLIRKGCVSRISGELSVTKKGCSVLSAVSHSDSGTIIDYVNHFQWDINALDKYLDEHKDHLRGKSQVQLIYDELKSDLSFYAFYDFNSILRSMNLFERTGVNNPVPLKSDVLRNDLLELAETYNLLECFDSDGGNRYGVTDLGREYISYLPR